MTPTIAEIEKRLEKATRPPPALESFKEPLGPTLIRLAIKAQAEEFLANAPADIAFLLAEVARLTRALEVADAALAKIEDPRLRDHKEPDAYTELGCVMNIAEVSRASIAQILGGG